MHKMDSRKNEPSDSISPSSESDRSRHSPLRSPQSQYPPLDLDVQTVQGTGEEQRSPYNTILHPVALQSFPSQEFMQHNSQTLTPGVSVSENFLPYNSNSQHYIPQYTTSGGFAPYDPYQQNFPPQNSVSESFVPYNPAPQEVQGYLHQDGPSQDLVPLQDLKSQTEKAIAVPEQKVESGADDIQYSTPRRGRIGLRTPKKNSSLKALENVNNLLDRKCWLVTQRQT